MTVLEAIAAAATELGIAEEVNDYLEARSDAGKTATENLLRCFNLVENELALDYLPLIAEEELETDTGTVYFSELTRSAVRILRVSDRWGNEAEFTLFPEYMKTQAGVVKIRYSYTPTEKTYADRSDFLLHASVRLFAYGMAAEYCLAGGLFEEAAVWDAKYKSAIEAAYRAQPSKKIKSRRWV